MRTTVPHHRAWLWALILGVLLVWDPLYAQAQSRERGRTSSRESSTRTETRKRSTEAATKSRARTSEASRSRSTTRQTSRGTSRTESTGRSTNNRVREAPKKSPQTERSRTTTRTRTSNEGNRTRSTTRTRTENEGNRTRTTTRSRTVTRDGDDDQRRARGTRNQRVTPDARGGRVVEGNRSRYEDQRRLERVPERPRYSRRDAYQHKQFHGKRRYPVYRPNHTHIHVDLHWPWVNRYQRWWAPRYRYRQVVYVEAGWGRHRRTSRVEVQTTYRHRVTYANNQYAELDLTIEAVELYENGRFLGYISDIPYQLRTLEATVYRDGHVRFNRNVFILGDVRSGFEMIATRHYDGYLLDRYDRRDGYKVGRVDLRRGRVVAKRHSQLFDPYDFNGHVPISLLPEDEAWLWDQGFESVSSHYDDYDYYYGMQHDAYVDQGYDAYGQPNTDAVYLRAPSSQVAPRSSTSGADVGTAPVNLSREDEVSYETQRGGRVTLRREMQIERVH